MSSKFLLWIIGFLSILCFNARSSIDGNFLLLLVYLHYMLIMNKRVKSSVKVKLFWSILVFFIICYIFIFQFGLGGRLLDIGLFDENSSQVRLNAWELFRYYDIDKFLYGHTFEENMAIRFSTGLYRLENFWLGYMLSCGLIFLLIYTILYYFVFKYFLRNYNLFNKLFVSMAFLLIASTNNSLDGDFLYLFYFLLLSIVFDPLIFDKLVDKKYYSNR